MSKRNKVLLGGGGIVLLVILVLVSASAKRFGPSAAKRSRISSLTAVA